MTTSLIPLAALPWLAAFASGLSAIDDSVSRARLAQALSSPSGKLTFSPELVIPEPTDPTAILLQTNAIQGLSSKIRNSKANAAFLDGSLTALQTFVVEQESARGNFPGPVPVIYCGGAVDTSSMKAIAEAGAEGVLIQVCDGGPIASAGDIYADVWVRQCQEAMDCGLQPIPEVTIPQSAVAEGWQDGEQVSKVVNDLTEMAGVEPVAVVLTVSNDADDEQAAEESEGSEEEAAEMPLPFVPKELNKKVPIIGSIQTPAGDGRLAAEAGRFKASGFLGGFLRRECIPGFRVQLDLEIVGKFWAGCITDLKSTKSKSFSFRSKNNMETSVATKWGNYQKSIMDSGALGDPNESYSVVDEAAGEYKGFA